MARQTDHSPVATRARLFVVLMSLFWLAIAAALGTVIYLRVQAQPETQGYFTSEQARDGELAYNQHCASCHGPDLAGVSAPALVGDTFFTRWGGQSVEALYNFVHDQMPLGQGGTLSDETYAGTVAYILEQNGLASGDTAIGSGAPHMADLIIQADAPTEADQTEISDAEDETQEPDENPADNPDGAIQSGITQPSHPGALVFFNQCAACHGSDGAGGIGPALQDNPRLEDSTWTVQRIARGGLGMPMFAQQLSVAEIADVTSFIRASFNNDYPEVDTALVEEVLSNIAPEQLQTLNVDLRHTSLGETRYVQLCAACHGIQGGGEVGPPLAGNTNLANQQLVITTMLYGRGIMPPFSLHSSLELAEIASYIRNAWGNAYGSLDAQTVMVYRPELASSAQSTMQKSSENQDVTQGAPEDNSPLQEVNPIPEGDDQ